MNTDKLVGMMKKRDAEVRKKSLAEWSSFWSHNFCNIKVGGFDLHDGTWLEAYSIDHSGLKTIKKWHLDRMEDCGLEGCVITGDWWDGYTLTMFFRGREQCERAVERLQHQFVRVFTRPRGRPRA